MRFTIITELHELTKSDVSSSLKFLIMKLRPIHKKGEIKVNHNHLKWLKIKMNRVIVTSILKFATKKHTVTSFCDYSPKL